MSRPVMMMDMRVRAMEGQHPDAARRPEDREERSERSKHKHGGVRPHRMQCTGNPGKSQALLSR